MQGDPLLRGRPRDRLRRGGFETVSLNAAGWSTLVGAGLLPGVAVVLATDVPAPVALPAGVVAAWAAALVADHLRWRNGVIGIGRGDLDEATGTAIVERLRELGIEAEYREVLLDDEDGGGVQRQVECRNADVETVRRVIDEELRGRV